MGPVFSMQARGLLVRPLPVDGREAVLRYGYARSGNMSNSNLSADVTLWDVRASLQDEDKYVREALDILRNERAKHPDVVLRLGIMGTGAMPNYRVEASGAPLYAMDGAANTRWPPSYDFSDPKNWSEKTMTFSEVEDVLRAIRKR
jgi:hypothetical protein